MWSDAMVCRHRISLIFFVVNYIILNEMSVIGCFMFFYGSVIKDSHKENGFQNTRNSLSHNSDLTEKNGEEEKEIKLILQMNFLVWKYLSWKLILLIYPFSYVKIKNHLREGNQMTYLFYESENHEWKLIPKCANNQSGMLMTINSVRCNKSWVFWA